MTSTTETQAYKDALRELLEAMEKLEPIVQKAKQVNKAANQDEYIQLIEEQNRILKERVQQLEDVNNYSSNCGWSSYNESSGSFNWNSLFIFFLCVWFFLVFIGF
jgi:hypothetical protein